MKNWNLKDTISTIVAVILPFIEPINYFLLSNEPFNWKTFVASLLGALVAYATGKNADMSKKTPVQVDIQQQQKHISDRP